jgi:hypothetical protein
MSKEKAAWTMLLERATQKQGITVNSKKTLKIISFMLAHPIVSGKQLRLEAWGMEHRAK